MGRFLDCPLSGVVTTNLVACIASVCVGLESKERPKNGIFGVCPHGK